MSAEEIQSLLFEVLKVSVILFIAVYSYQVAYLFIPFLCRKKVSADIAVANKRYAFLIAARNEAHVIGELIQSIRCQNYPQELIDIFVVADNCTDDTAVQARAAGAVVFERENKVQVGKSYALEFLLKQIKKSSRKNFDGYFVFDADNLLDENYVTEMNKTFNEGYHILTSYRNSKNYGKNWISAGYALWFLKDSKFLNEPRMLLGKSTIVTGTGYLFSQEILDRTHGWKFHLLTEDVEFSTYHILQGETVGYCKDAVFYDEQPESFMQSWNQRARWIKGYFQVFRKYKKALLYRLFTTGDFTYYDMMMLFIPAFVLTAVQVAANILLLGFSIINNHEVEANVMLMLESVLISYVLLAVAGALTTISEWHKIYAPWQKKIGYIFTFPLFVYTYFPIACYALFKNVEWTPIVHKHAVKLHDIVKN